MGLLRAMSPAKRDTGASNPNIRVYFDILSQSLFISAIRNLTLFLANAYSFSGRNNKDIGSCSMPLRGGFNGIDIS